MIAKVRSILSASGGEIAALVLVRSCGCVSACVCMRACACTLGLMERLNILLTGMLCHRWEPSGNCSFIVSLGQRSIPGSLPNLHDGKPPARISLRHDVSGGLHHQMWRRVFPILPASESLPGAS